jgi:hypothetical protein
VARRLKLKPFETRFARPGFASVALLLLLVGIVSAALALPGRTPAAVDEGGEATGDGDRPAEAPSGREADEPAHHRETHNRYLDTGAWTREPDPKDDWG